MTEQAPKTADRQQIHYYHNIKWRLLAEVPWLVITVIMALIMFFRIILIMGGPSELLFRSLVPNMMLIGFLALPMIVIVASGDVDLSMGFLAGLVGWIIASLGPGMGLGAAIVVSLVVALLVGLINGLLVGLSRLKGIVITLAMSLLLSGLILTISDGQTMPAPEGLNQELARSPLIVVLWLLLALACAALMIFTPLGRRPRAGDPGQESVGSRLLFKGLPYVFSSFMAWMAGILLLSWVGYATVAAGSGYSETALLVALLGGTAYYAGTGFVLSGMVALFGFILFQNGNMLSNLSLASQRVIQGVLLLVMLPITHYYHIGVDWLYHRQNKKVESVPVGDVPQTQ
jgi:ribose/xylose/arabinose/galactoside ABC-type transport system permease subunit